MSNTKKEAGVHTLLIHDNWLKEFIGFSTLVARFNVRDEMIIDDTISIRLNQEMN